MSSKLIHFLGAALVFCAAQFSSSLAWGQESVPAQQGYVCPGCNGIIYPTGQAACTAQGIAITSWPYTYTDLTFVPPEGCSYTYQDHRDTYPIQHGVAATWAARVQVCPGGSIPPELRLGYYTAMTSDYICICKPGERFYPDAVGPKKCIWVAETGTTGAPANDPSDNGPSCNCAGQPINPGTGNMWHIESDYAPVNAASSLSLKRTYNSTPFSWDVSVVRSFGARWSEPYDIALRAEAPPLAGKSTYDGRCWRREDTGAIWCEVPPPPVVWPAIPEAVSISRGDGKKYYFVRSGGNWVGEADTNDRITAVFNADGSAVASWLYTSAQGDSSERFDAGGRLISITARNGSSRQFTYSAGSTNDTTVARTPYDAPACTNVQAGATLPAGRLLCVTDNWGHQLQFEYDVKGHIVKAIAPGNEVIQYEYDGPSGGCPTYSESNPACNSDNLTKATYADGKSRVYYYNEAPQINGGVTCPGTRPMGPGLAHLPNAWTSLVDENGARHISWTYGCIGRATSSQLAGGADKITIAYENYSADYGPTGGATMLVTHYSGSLQSPVATTTQWRYKKVLGSAKIVYINQPCAECGDFIVTDYDANGNISRQQEWNTNNETTYTYDLTRNLQIRRLEGEGSTRRTISTQWHPSFRLPIKIAEPKRISTFTYDANGNLLNKTLQASGDATGAQGLNAAGVGATRSWTYAYNAFGQILTVTGPRTDVADITRYDYDSASGNLITITNAAGHVTTFSNYDPSGRMGTIISPSGVRTDLTYTARGWLETQTVSSGASVLTTSYVYDGAGQLKLVTLPDQSTLSYSYDDAHRLTDVSDNLGNAIHYVLDVRGNRTQELAKDPAGILTRQIARVYSAMNRLQSVTGSTQ